MKLRANSRTLLHAICFDPTTWAVSAVVFTSRVVMLCCRRVSVCQSVTSRHCTKTAKQRITKTAPGTLVYRCLRSRRTSNGVTSNGGAKQRWGRFRSVIFDQYLAIGLSQKRCKIGTSLLLKLIRTRMRSIEWCCFQ